MKVSFIGHNLKEGGRTVGNLLIESFKDSEFRVFDSFIAFASLSGVTGLSKVIQQSKGHLHHFRVIVGIDQQGTSKEALEALMKIGIDAGIYYTISPVIFHPKIYIFNGEKKCRIIIGSSNLTTPGLFQNLEASIVIDFNKPDSDGEKILHEMYDYFKAMFMDSVNLHSLTKELIENLFRLKIIPSESERKKERDADSDKSEPGIEIPADFRTTFPPVKIGKPPSEYKPQRITSAGKNPMAGSESNTKIPAKLVPAQPIPAKKAPSPAVTHPKPSPSIPPVPINSWAVKGSLVWRKGNLPASDVQYEKAGTAVTGGLRLTQAGWMEGGKPIDQTTYFRNKLFGGFLWRRVRSTPFVEITQVQFQIKILGVDKGLHRLILRHKPSGEAGQNNYTTILSWGDFGGEISRTDLRGRELLLSRPPIGKKEPFFIEIR